MMRPIKLNGLFLSSVLCSWPQKKEEKSWVMVCQYCRTAVVKTTRWKWVIFIEPLPLLSHLYGQWCCLEIKLHHPSPNIRLCLGRLSANRVCVNSWSCCHAACRISFLSSLVRLRGGIGGGTGAWAVASTWARGRWGSLNCVLSRALHNNSLLSEQKKSRNKH